MTEYALRLSDQERGRYRLMAETALRTEGELWAAAGIVEGASVADVGCGPGAVSAVLAGLVGPAGRVLAVDGDPEAVASARETCELAGVGNVTVAEGDAADTGLPAGSVDVAMVRHVLAHNGGREQAIVDHVASLVRPGGTVFLVDIEFGALRSRPSDPDIEHLNTTYHGWHAKRGNDLSVGLRLAELLAGAGLEVTHFEGRYQIIEFPAGMRSPGWAARDAMVASGAATADDVARWEAAFARLDGSEKRPLLFAPVFLATGRRPS
ncbi:MAG TPA: methyltransferase domain-containing protein [Acidimicrobiales bacterium]|nr:methyltransferase domain-containing protein [Acidimicrobiales bacterium]